MTLFTPIGSADVIYLESDVFFVGGKPAPFLRNAARMEHRANSDPFDAADTSSRSASGGAGDDTFSLYTFTERIQIFNQII